MVRTRCGGAHRRRPAPLHRVESTVREWTPPCWPSTPPSGAHRVEVDAIDGSGAAHPLGAFLLDFGSGQGEMRRLHRLHPGPLHRTECGAAFTDERWKATARVAGRPSPAKRPSLCGDCDQRFEADLGRAWGVSPRQGERDQEQDQEQDQAVPKQKGTGWFSRLRLSRASRRHSGQAAWTGGLPTAVAKQEWQRRLPAGLPDSTTGLGQAVPGGLYREGAAQVSGRLH